MKKLTVIILACLSVSAMSLWAGDITGTVTCKGVRNSKDVVVYIKEIGDTTTVPTEHAVMDQKGLEFLPHVLPVQKGATVDYLNSDDVLHNVFTPDGCAEKMNLGTWPKGEVRSYTFNELGCVSVMLCNVHPEMEAWILVLQNGYYFKTDKEGKYEIKDVPPGEYTLVAWHEKLKPQSQAITVPKEGIITSDFTLKRK